jgi:hypothetical protein
MLRHLRIAASLIAILFLVPNFTYADSRPAFHDAMRKLWVDHVTWTRLFIISAVGDLPDKAVTTQRLLQNQTDIGNAVAEFYGRQAGDKLTALLKVPSRCRTSHEDCIGPLRAIALRHGRRGRARPGQAHTFVAAEVSQLHRRRPGRSGKGGGHWASLRRLPEVPVSATGRVTSITGWLTNPLRLS